MYVDATTKLTQSQDRWLKAHCEGNNSKVTRSGLMRELLRVIIDRVTDEEMETIKQKIRADVVENRRKFAPYGDIRSKRGRAGK